MKDTPDVIWLVADREDPDHVVWQGDQPADHDGGVAYTKTSHIEKHASRPTNKGGMAEFVYEGVVVGAGRGKVWIVNEAVPLEKRLMGEELIEVSGGSLSYNFLEEGFHCRRVRLTMTVLDDTPVRW